MAPTTQQDATKTGLRPVKTARKTAPLVVTTSEVLVVGVIAHTARELSELSITRREILQWADELDGWVECAERPVA